MVDGVPHKLAVGLDTGGSVPKLRSVKEIGWSRTRSWVCLLAPCKHCCCHTHAQGQPHGCQARSAATKRTTPVPVTGNRDGRCRCHPLPLSRHMHHIQQGIARHPLRSLTWPRAVCGGGGCAAAADMWPILPCLPSCAAVLPCACRCDTACGQRALSVWCCLSASRVVLPRVKGLKLPDFKAKRGNMSPGCSWV